MSEIVPDETVIAEIVEESPDEKPSPNLRIRGKEWRERLAGEKELDKNIRIAICYGAGLPVERIKVLCDFKDPHTFYDRAKKFADFNRWKDFAAAALAAVVESRVKREDSAMAAEVRIAEIHLRALKITEKLVERAEGKGDNISLKEAWKIHDSITKWSAQFAASQAPKRVQLLGEVKHTHILADETIDRMTRFADKYESRGLLPGQVVEAEVVS